MEFITRKDGTKYEIIERLTTGLIKVKLPNGSKAAVNNDGEIQYIINPSAQEIADEERAKTVDAIRDVIRDELQAFKTELLEDLTRKDGAQ